MYIYICLLCIDLKRPSPSRNPDPIMRTNRFSSNTLTACDTVFARCNYGALVFFLPCAVFSLFRRRCIVLVSLCFREEDRAPLKHLSPSQNPDPIMRTNQFFTNALAACVAVFTRCSYGALIFFLLYAGISLFRRRCTGLVFFVSAREITPPFKRSSPSQHPDPIVRTNRYSSNALTTSVAVFARCSYSALIFFLLVLFFLYFSVAAQVWFFFVSAREIAPPSSARRPPEIPIRSGTPTGFP